MSKITHEHVFAARDVSPVVEVTTTTRPTGEALYLLRVGGLGVDHEFTEEEARALASALELAIQTQADTDHEKAETD